MILHIIAVLIAQVMLFLLDLYNTKTILHKDGKLYPLYSRLSASLMLILSQGIFIYLLIKFQRPIKLEARNSTQETSRNESVESSLETIIRRNVVRESVKDTETQ